MLLVSVNSVYINLRRAVKRFRCAETDFRISLFSADLSLRGSVQVSGSLCIYFTLQLQVSVLVSTSPAAFFSVLLLAESACSSGLSW